MAPFYLKDDTNQLNRTSPHSESPVSSGSPRGSSKRRKFLQMAVRGAVAGFVTPAGMELVTPRSVRAQTTLTPKMALKELVEGNQRFVAVNMTSFDLDLAILRNHTSELQQPFAAVLACADSRVPVELVFDQSIGQIFVTRLAGNIATSEIIASLEYGAAVLGVKVILVMGHSFCGAVEAALKHEKAPGQISALYPHIQPAIDLAGRDLDATAKANARIQAGLLRKASTVISGLVKEGKLLVRAAFYNIASGEVSLLPRWGADSLLEPSDTDTTG
jgi:carbonic anhydrase